MISIGEKVFAYSGFTNIEVSNENPAYSSVDGVLYNKNRTALICYPANKQADSFSIPFGVTQLSDYSFEECDLTSITIPNSVANIGAMAFAFCSGLTEIFVSWLNPFEVSLDVFEGVDKSNCTLHIPIGTKEKYENSEGWAGFKIIDDVVTGLSELKEQPINLYPNPVQEGFHISGVPQAYDVKILDTSGKIMFSSPSTGQEFLDISHLPYGIYLVIISIDQQLIYQSKIIKTGQGF